MDPCAAALPLAASRIAESHFPKARRPGLDIAGLGVVEEFKRSLRKDSSSPSAEIRFVKTVVSMKARSSTIYTTMKYTTG
jgi:hypothetical protein